MASTPEERKTIIKRMLAEGAAQKEIAKAIGMSIATVNKIVQGIRAEAAEESRASDLKPDDMLTKEGAEYVVTEVTGALIKAKSLLKKGKDITIPVVAWREGTSGYRKKATAPIVRYRKGQEPPTSEPQEKIVEKPKPEMPKTDEEAPKKETVGKALERMREKPMTRGDILQKATHTVCHARQDQYGDPEDNFAAIARLWEEYLGREVSPKDVASMMILFKVARVTTGKAHLDNWVDIAGYAALAGELESKEECK